MKLCFIQNVKKFIKMHIRHLQMFTIKELLQYLSKYMLRELSFGSIHNRDLLGVNYMYCMNFFIPTIPKNSKPIP